jgi:hypothetical protein
MDDKKKTANDDQGEDNKGTEGDDKACDSRDDNSSGDIRRGNSNRIATFNRIAALDGIATFDGSAAVDCDGQRPSGNDSGELA